MRCWYFLLVAQVRIVVAVLPINGDNCSMKRIRGKVGDSGKRAACAAQANASGAAHPMRDDDFLDKVSHGSDIVECFGQVQYLTVALERDRATMFMLIQGPITGASNHVYLAGRNVLMSEIAFKSCSAFPTFRRRGFAAIEVVRLSGRLAEGVPRHGVERVFSGDVPLGNRRSIRVRDTTTLTCSRAGARLPRADRSDDGNGARTLPQRDPVSARAFWYLLDHTSALVAARTSRSARALRG